MKLKRTIKPMIMAGVLAVATAHAALIPVTTDLAANTTTTWYATNEYRLDTVVYVQTNATLIIEPGTVVKGGTNTANLFTRPGLPNLVSALWVTRGGKLYATGTVVKPIIFTMEGDDVNDPDDIPPTLTGQWGGIVMMGNGVINSSQNSTGQVAAVKFDVYEGVQSIGNNGEHLFGGTNDLDSSGALRYVSIRHTGNTFASARELNGLTMGAVGSETDISYVEVFASSDDGFEWWGGTVNTHHLVGAFNEDDDFDTDQGYRGTNQFWFAIKPPWQGSGDSRGIESDGDLDNDGTPPLGDAQPFSQWTVYNMTLIGRGKASTLFGGGSAWNARDEAAPNVINSVIAQFNNGLLMDADGLFHWTNSPALANALNNVWDNTTAANANGLPFINDVNRSNTVAAAGLGGISYTNDVATLDPRPQPGSPALTNALAGAPVAVSYRGAFSGETDGWADGWTALSTEGYLVAASNPAPNPVTLTISSSGANVSISFNSQSGYTYTLESAGALTPAGWGAATGVTPSNPQIGTGGTLTFTVPAAGANYFQVKAN